MKTHSEILRMPRHAGVTVAEARSNSRISHKGDDSLFARILKAAYKHVQDQAVGSSLLPTTWQQVQPCFSSAIELAKGPVIEALSVKYLDTDGAEQTVDAADYRLEAGSRPSIVLVGPASWPATKTANDAVRITYAAGSGVKVTFDDDTHEAIPGDNRFEENESVRLTNFGGDLPDPLEDNVEYFVRERNAVSFKLAVTEGGAEIELDDAGTGTTVIDWLEPDFKQAVMMLTAYWYEQPEAFTTGKVHHDVGLRLQDLIESAGGRVCYS